MLMATNSANLKISQEVRKKLIINGKCEKQLFMQSVVQVLSPDLFRGHTHVHVPVLEIFDQHITLKRQIFCYDMGTVAKNPSTNHSYELSTRGTS